VDKLLRQFIEVATLKNVSHAANRLCLSQPTLTHNMKKLEDNLGVQLLVRSSSGVTLTEYGELLLEQARMMQRIYDNTLIRMDLLKERQERSLKIGSGHAWWHMFLRETFEAHRHQYPTANVHIDLGNHLRLMDLLLSGDIDLFIGHEIQGLNPKAGVSFLPLLSSTDACYVRTGHPLRERTVGKEDAVDLPSRRTHPRRTPLPARDGGHAGQAPRAAATAHDRAGRLFHQLHHDHHRHAGRHQRCHGVSQLHAELLRPLRA
jgi:DNA-binding transcriptional LysR family regulator